MSEIWVLAIEYARARAKSRSDVRVASRQYIVAGVLRSYIRIHHIQPIHFIFSVQQIEYSEDEEIGCKDFTRDFYKLVNIASNSTRSLQSPSMQAPACLAECAGIEADCDTDDSDDSDDGSHAATGGPMGSPTPSEAGLAQVSSCSSSSSNSSSTSSTSSGNSDDRCLMDDTASVCSVRVPVRPPPRVDSLLPSAAAAVVTAAATSAAAAAPAAVSAPAAPASTTAATVPAAAQPSANGPRVLRPPRSTSNHALHKHFSRSNSSGNACGRFVSGTRTSAPPPLERTASAASASRRSSSDSRSGASSSATNGVIGIVTATATATTTTTSPMQSMLTTHWRSTGWRRVSSNQHNTVSTLVQRNRN